MNKYEAEAAGVAITITGEGGDKGWIQLQSSPEKRLNPDLIEECVDVLRKLQTTGQVQLTAEALYFTLGQDLLDWVEEVKATLQPGEVKQ